ncbi:MAG: class I SAM-dependent methyltransferase [Nocardioides sp.]
MSPQSPPDPAPTPGWEEIWAAADAVPGWLTEAQGRLLYDQALACPAGATLLEIGSHQGRSTVVLAHAARQLGGSVIAIDPFVEGRLFGGQTTAEKFERNLTAAGVRDLVRHVGAYSTQARPDWDEAFDFLYIDGKHDFWTLSDDLLWRTHLPADAPVLVHDAYSSIGVTLGILARVLPSRDLRYVKRAGSLALFRCARPTWADRRRVLAEVPWWLRNVGIKVLLRLRLRPVARLVGHDSPYDPY